MHRPRSSSNILIDCHTDPFRAARPISGLTKRRRTGLSPGLYPQGNDVRRYYDQALPSDLPHLRRC